MRPSVVSGTVRGLAPDRAAGAGGAALTGFGYALVNPGLGVEAVRRARRKAAASEDG